MVASGLHSSVEEQPCSAEQCRYKTVVSGATRHKHTRSIMLVLVLAALLGGVAALPAPEDTAMVGSSVLQASVAPPPDLQAAGDHSRAGGDKGYHHSYKTKGGDGYKHFDSFHKKDGDSYGYEKHSTFGKGDHGDDGGHYHESSSYDSGDGASGSHNKPKVTAYHYESKSGTPRDYSNYDPETYVGDYTNVAPRRAPHPDVEVTGPLRNEGEQYQTLYDVSGGKPAPKKARKQRSKSKDPQTAGTEEEAEYDYYGGEDEGEGDEGSSEGYYEGEGDYEGDGGSEADYYY